MRIYLILILCLIIYPIAATELPAIEKLDSKIIYENLSYEYDNYEYVINATYTNKTNNNNWSTYEYVYTGRKTKYVTGKEIGLIVEGKKYNKDSCLEGNILSTWIVDIGDRNKKEFCRCLPSEIKKTCSEKIIKKAIIEEITK